MSARLGLYPVGVQITSSISSVCCFLIIYPPLREPEHVRLTPRVLRNYSGTPERASHPHRNLDCGTPYLPLALCRRILMDSERTVDFATVQRSPFFDKLKDIDLVGRVPGNLFESPSPLTHMFSTS